MNVAAWEWDVRSWLWFRTGENPTAVEGKRSVSDALRKGTRVSGADRSELAAQLRRRYDEGESIRSLAAATGRSYGFVHRLLSETGVELRGRGGATRKA